MLTRDHRWGLIGMSAAVLAVGLAAPALADPPPEPGHPTNFGQCAAFEARDFPAGPDHGQDLRTARLYNPSGLGLECTK